MKRNKKDIKWIKIKYQKKFKSQDKKRNLNQLKISPKIKSLIKFIFLLILSFFEFLHFKSTKIQFNNNLISNIKTEATEKIETIEKTEIIEKIGTTENIKNTETMVKIEKIDNNTYFSCFCGMGKLENKYTRQLVEYYKEIGFEKFILGDNNDPNTEKLIDVIKDYVDKGIVDIIDIIGVPIGQAEFYIKVYSKYNQSCKWISFFDFDEYLYLLYENKTINNIKTFLSNEIYNKCESVSFNWVIYDDNDLVYYDNRTDIERFKRPLFNHESNKFIKSIVRGNLNKTVFIKLHSNHIPEKEVVCCSSNGEVIKNYDPFCVSPRYDYGYLIHFSTKTAEEYSEKVKRGHPLINLMNALDERLKIFFGVNKFTDEKFNVFEKQFKQKFNRNNFVHYSLR